MSGVAINNVNLTPLDSQLRVQTFRSDLTRTSINIGPPQIVPEPATLLLLGTGLAGVAAGVRSRRKAHHSEE